MGHTPGPWGCDGTEVHAEHLVICNAYRSRTDDEGNWMSSEEVEANARLIAAAPDLLASLKAIVEASQFEGEVAWLEKLWPQVDAALDEAEGTDGQTGSLD